VVLTREEVRRVLAQVEGTEHLFLTLLYGTGLRRLEGLRLRVKDVDFAENQITVRDGKGAKDRVAMLPVSIQVDLRRHLRGVEHVHKKDLGEGFWEGLPSVRPRLGNGAGRPSDTSSPYVFPAAGRSRDRDRGSSGGITMPEQSIRKRR
jgi:integrase